VGYTKLDENLVTSSMWSEDDKTLRVWVYLMARAGANGAVLDTIPAIARACAYDIGTVSSILDKLSSPDPYSRTRDHEGRRIAILHDPEFAIYLLNHSKYRGKSYTPAERSKSYRDRHAPSRDVTGVTPSVTAETQAEAEAEAEAEATANGSSVSQPLESEQAVDVRKSPKTGLTQEQETEYATAVELAIAHRRGNDLPMPSNLDHQEIRRWMESGIPLRIALRGIEDCSKAPQNIGARYYGPAVREAYGQYRKAIA
jgi:hypothetical protein